MRANVYQSGRRCSELEIVDASACCPFCSFSGSRTAVLRLQRNPDISLLECPRCKAASASQMPKPETLSAYYSGYYSNSDKNCTFHKPGELIRHIYELVSPSSGSLASPYRILDFGGGDGTIAIGVAERLLNAGFDRVEIDLVELQQLPPPDHSSGISLTHSQSLTGIAAGTYNLALASSILEHLPNPRPDLTGVLSALAPGGVFFSRTSWVAPVFRVYEQLGLSFDFTYPAHVHDLGREFWERIIPYLPLADPGAYKLRHSRPSLVETSFRNEPFRTAVAHLMKALWRPFPAWRLVGGWEVLIERSRSTAAPK